MFNRKPTLAVCYLTPLMFCLRNEHLNLLFCFVYGTNTWIFCFVLCMLWFISFRQSTTIIENQNNKSFCKQIPRIQNKFLSHFSLRMREHLRTFCQARRAPVCQNLKLLGQDKRLFLCYKLEYLLTCHIIKGKISVHQDDCFFYSRRKVRDKPSKSKFAPFSVATVFANVLFLIFVGFFVVFSVF